MWLTVAIGTEADQLGVNARAAGARSVEALEHESRRAFPDHEAVALRVEGPRRARGLVVARAGRVEHVEDRRLDRVMLLGTPCDHHLLQAVADRFRAVANALAARGTGGAGRHHAPAHPEELREIRGDRVAHVLQVLVRPHSDEGALAEEFPGVHLQRRRATGGRPVGDPDGSIPQLGGVRQTGVAQCQLGRARGEQRNPPHAARAFAVGVRGPGEVAHARCESRAQAVDLPQLGQHFHAGASLEQRRSDRLPVFAQCAQSGHARDHHASGRSPSGHASPPLIEMTWPVM